MRLLWIVLTLLLIGGAVALVDALRGQEASDPLRVDGAGTSAARGAREFAESLASTTSTAPDAGHDPPQDAAPLSPDALAAELLASSSARAAEPSPPPGLAVPQDEAERETVVVPDDAPRLTDGLDATIPGVTIVPGVIVRMPDGSIRADDRFTIRGAGSAEDPFRVTWELLMSAGELYQPRLGRLEIPQRVALLHGRQVRIDGYAAFPIFSFDPKEMLAMLNQWDGCCIGVPPTPYDAIEVKLASTPRDRKRQLAYFGTTTGKLSVEPYLVENWLVGLYLMDDAAFTMDM